MTLAVDFRITKASLLRLESARKFKSQDLIPETKEAKDETQLVQNHSRGSVSGRCGRAGTGAGDG
ncbi:MAG: hypothetical protein Q7U75_13910, partial [Desulfobacterales bacterium]|nr:hypothetical protein [Desulfobacterales bacterium]